MGASARAEFDEAYETEQRRLNDADGSFETDVLDWLRDDQRTRRHGASTAMY
jgi:hypothetical protein